MRFESDLPNETWQSDMTHWQLKDDQPVDLTDEAERQEEIDQELSALRDIVGPTPG
jgi:hypothetical protein